MRRRDLLVLAAATAVQVPLGTRAADRKRRIGFLSVGAKAPIASLETPFREQLATFGWGDDKIEIESRWADGYVERLPSLAAELLGMSPDVLVAGSGVVAGALKRATRTIPIVFAISDDPVGTGLVASLAHPGSNLTGLSFAQEDTIGRELQLLKTIAPSARRVAVLVNPTSSSAHPIVRRLRQEAGSLQTDIIVAETRSPADIEPAFAELKGQGAEALLVLGDGLFTSERKRLIGLAAKNHLPAIYHDHIFVEDGGLMSYGGDFADNYRGAAVLVDKILKGAKPADLPVQEPSRFYLYINRKTATALGLTIPPLLEAQADKVIE